MTSEVLVDRLRKDGCSNRSVESKRHVPPHIRTGRILFARCRGQPFHIARILMVDTIRLRCYMRFEDGTTHWCRFCNIQRFNCDETTCCLCHENVTTSQVVFCAQCKLGFHPHCHNPSVTAEEVHDNSWACRVCSFSDTVVIDGLGKRLDSTASSCSRQTSVQPKQRDYLDWDEKHQTNKQNIYCYCRKPGRWSNCMLQCLKCLQWFHYACIFSLKTKPLAGDTLFVFVCSQCMASGQEYTRRIQLKWIHVVQLALYRLQRDRNETDKRKERTKRAYFDLAKDIMPWINSNWKQLLPGRLINHLKDKREARVAAVLKNHPKRFLKCGNQKKNGSLLWSLKKDRPLAPPRIWLPDNGTPLTARFLDQATTEMGIKCVKQGKAEEAKRKSLSGDSVRSSQRDHSVLLSSEKYAASDTNSSSHSNEIPGNRARNSKKLNSTTNKSLPKAEFRSDLRSVATDFENNASESLRSVPSSNCTSSRNATSVVEPDSAAGRGKTNNTCDAVYKSRLTGAFKSKSKLRKNHMLNGKAVSTKLSQLRKSQPGFAKSSAQLLLGGGGVPEPPNKAPSFDELFRVNDIAKSLKHPSNVVNKEAIDEISSAEVSHSHLQSSVGQYFGAASRLARGERFRIMGKRVTSTGKLQYLVEWEGGVC